MTDLAVIMAVYQNDKLNFLKESVQSILDQTFTQFDYYIIFDGPVAPEINSYITSIGDDRIRFFRLEQNAGLASALNFLLKIVLSVPGYKFIVRMDADDISLPSRFEKQRSFLSENEDVSIAGSWYEEIDESGKHLADRKLPTDHDSLKKRYMTRTPFAHPSVMYTRNLIETAGYYPTNTVLMEDNVLWGRALKNGFRFANIPEYLFKFRIDKDFYKRRSGIKYGLNYIRVRSKLIIELRLPVYCFLSTFAIGFIKMLPSFLIRPLYSFFI